MRGLPARWLRMLEALRLWARENMSENIKEGTFMIVWGVFGIETSVDESGKCFGGELKVGGRLHGRRGEHHRLWGERERRSGAGARS